MSKTLALSRTVRDKYDYEWRNGRLVNILLINHYAGTPRAGMEYRPFYLAREWCKNGNNTCIIAADYSHLRTVQPVIKRDLDCTYEDGVKYRWLKTNRYDGNGLARVANMMTFVTKLVAHARQIAEEERPSIVICSSTYPFDIFAGERIARLAGAKLVYELHDVWPLTPMLLGNFSRYHPFIQAAQYAEDRCYRVADTVVSILPNTKPHMVARGMSPEKFAHIPNGIPIDEAAQPPTQVPEPVRQFIAEEKNRGKFLIGYAGSLNLSNAMTTLVEAAVRVRDSNITLVLAGDGAERQQLEKICENHALQNVKMVGTIQKACVPAFLAAMDACVLCLQRSPLYAHGVSPNKIFDYMLAGRPIVQAIEAANDFVADADCGLTVPPGDPYALAAALLQMGDMFPAERQRLGENGKRYVLENHDYRRLAGRFLDAIHRKDEAAPPSNKQRFN